jgi:hypothetical protein
MKTNGEVEIQLHEFLTLALDGGEWSASHPGHFTYREKAPDTHWIGGWMGPTAGLDEVLKRKNSCSQWEMNPGCSAHSLVTILTELPWLWPATSWKDKFCASKSYKI